MKHHWANIIAQQTKFIQLIHAQNCVEKSCIRPWTLRAHGRMQIFETISMSSFKMSMYLNENKFMIIAVC